MRQPSVLANAFGVRLSFRVAPSIPRSEADGHMSLSITFLNQARLVPMCFVVWGCSPSSSSFLGTEKAVQEVHCGVLQAALRHMGSSAQGPFVSSFNIGSDEWEEAAPLECYKHV